MIGDIFAFLCNIFYLINDNQDTINKIIGWVNTNFFLFMIFFMCFLLSLEYCIKVVKFFCWIFLIIFFAALFFLLSF